MADEERVKAPTSDSPQVDAAQKTKITGKASAFMAKYNGNISEAIKAMDKDKSGGLDAKELGVLLAEIGYGNSFTRAIAGPYLVGKFDKNKNEQIDRDEVADFEKMIDKNGDGVISQDEIDSVAK